MKITANFFYENKTKLKGLTESPAHQPKEFILLLFFFFGVYWKKIMSHCIPYTRTTLEDCHSICLKSPSQFFFKSKLLILSQLKSPLTSLIRCSTLSWSLRPMMTAILQAAWILDCCGATDILGKHSTIPLNADYIKTEEI